MARKKAVKPPPPKQKSKPVAAKKRSANTAKNSSSTNPSPPHNNDDPAAAPKAPKACRFDVEILPTPAKTPTDRNYYRGIKLPNGVRALLIHSPPKEQISSSKPCQPREDQDRWTIPNCPEAMPQSGSSFLDPATWASASVWSFVQEDLDPCSPTTTSPSSGCGGTKIPTRNGRGQCQSGGGGPEVNSGVRPGRGGGNNPMASIAVVVNAGASDGPNGRNGLAHFCEHAVHYGSKEFPQEDAYFSFLLNTTDSFNAFTATMTTTYFFDIRQNYLERGTHMLADMLSQPAFNESLLEREVRAVDNEYVLRRHNDIRLSFNLVASLAKKGHPLSHFGCGTHKTLLHASDGNQSVKKLKQDLTKFHKDKYVGTGITLALQSTISLDEMQEMVVNHFTKLPRGNGKIRREMVIKDSDLEPFATPEFHKMYIMAGKDNPEPYLIIQWPLPPTAWMDLENKPLDFLSELISAEWEHGLGRELRKDGLILGMYAGCPEGCEFHRNNYVSLFTIRIVLNVHSNDEDDDDYDDEDDDEEGQGDAPPPTPKILPKVHRILRLVYQHLARIRSTPSATREVIWNELAVINNNYVNYTLLPEGSSMTMKTAQNLQLRPEAEVFSSDLCLLNRYDDKVVTECLNLLSPERMNVIITLPPKLVTKCASEYSSKAWIKKVEPHYGTQYWGRCFERGVLEEMTTIWRGVQSSLVNMTRNPFDSLERPFQNYMDVGDGARKLGENEKLILYHIGNEGMDKNCHVGRVGIHIVSSAQSIYHLPNVCRLKMMKACLERILEPERNAMAHAGISTVLSIENSGTLLRLGVSGFPAKLPLAVATIMRTIFPVNDAEREACFPLDIFQSAKATLLNKLEEKLGEGSYLLDHLFQELMKIGTPSFRHYSKIVKSIGHEELVSFTKLMANSSIILMGVGGNVSEQLVNDIAGIICQLKYYPKLGLCEPKQADLLPLLPYGNKCIRVKSEARKEFNSIISNFYEFVPQEGIDVDGIVQFLMMSMRTAFFFTIRTRKQLAYYLRLVQIVQKNRPPMIMAQVCYPGARNAICKMDNDIDSFFIEYEAQHLKNMTPDEFKGLRKMWGQDKLANISLHQVKAFYQDTFLTEIKPLSASAAETDLLWNPNVLGKVQKFSIQVLAAEEKCKMKDCKDNFWTKPDGPCSPLWFASDGEIQSRYIKDVPSFRDGKYR